MLLSIQEYRRLVAEQPSIAGWLSVDDDIDLPPSRVELSLAAPDL